MNYISVKEAAEKWNVTASSVRKYCTSEQIPGAQYIGGEWHIPSDAKQPNGSKSSSPKKAETSTYHFPFFIFSPLYATPSLLTKDEQTLLHAQELCLRGEHFESICLCKKIISHKQPSHILVGTYVTIGFNSLVSGFAEEFDNALAKLTELTEAETEHRGDYVAILTLLRLHSEWNTDAALKLSPLSLSAEAMWFYKYMILITSLFTNDLSSESDYLLTEADCVYLEQNGMLPTLLMFYTQLLFINHSFDNTDAKAKYLRKYFDIIVRNKWYYFPVKPYNLAKDIIDKYISEYGDEAVAGFKKEYFTTKHGWSIIHKKYSGLDILEKFTPYQIEILWLISYNTTYEQIETIKSITPDELKARIAELMKLTNSTTEAELRDAARKMLTEFAE